MIANDQDDVPKGTRTERKTNTKFVTLAGLLAFGILAGALVGSQALNAAVAQTGDEGQNEWTDNAPFHHSGTSTVSTSGTATSSVKPDKVSVTVGVETNGTTAEEAASKNGDLMAQVIAALKGLGISESQISTSNYNVHPVYSHGERVNVCRVMEGYPIPPECYVSQEIVGYRASNSVTVTIDAEGDIDASKVIDAAIKAGATNISGVYFFISAERQEEIRDSLIGDAIANARHRAEVAAEALGMSISGVKSVSLNDVYFPYFGKSFDGSIESTVLFPGEQEVSMTVGMVFLMTDGVAVESGSFGLKEPAIDFLLSKLPELGIQTHDDVDVSIENNVRISEDEYQVDLSFVDANGVVHKAHIEVLHGEVIAAILDGESIL